MNEEVFNIDWCHQFQKKRLKQLSDWFWLKLYS